MTENQTPTSLDQTDSAAELDAKRAIALQHIMSELLPLGPDDRQNVLKTVATFFGTDLALVALPLSVGGAGASRPTSFQFSEEQVVPSPKAFMFEKSPKTDVERVACLAYYLAHFMGVPHLKTKDITALNTESAHKPFSNTATAVENATKMGYLVPSVKGSKQLSALGERFVEALPDREAARDIFEKARPRRGSNKKSLKG